MIESKIRDLNIVIRKDNSKRIYFRNTYIAQSTPLSYLSHFQDDEVFLIGSGPSISSQDITKLEKKSVFLMNGAFVLSDRYQFRQVFYVVTDHKFISHHPDICLRALKSTACCIFNSECIAIICDRFPSALKNCRFIVCDEIGRFSNPNKPDLQNMTKWALSSDLTSYDAKQSTESQAFGFSEQLNIGYFNCGTVMYAALQISICLAPKTIFIMGFDIGNSNRPRFYESHKVSAPSRLLGDFHSIIKPAFELAGEVLEKKQIKMVNLSPTSLMPEAVIPKLDFEIAIKP